MTAARKRGGTRPGAGRPSLGGERVSYRLDEATRAILRAVGEGNETEGIRRLAAGWAQRRR